MVSGGVFALQRFYKMYRVDDAQAVGVGRVSSRGLQHFLVLSGQARPASQRSMTPTPVENPQQLKPPTEINSGSRIAGEVFLATVRWRRAAQQKGLFPAPHNRSHWRRFLQAAWRPPPGEVNRWSAKVRRAEPASPRAPCASTPKARRLGLGERVAPEDGAFSNNSLPRGRGD